jgi:hypothetical protein
MTTSLITKLLLFAFAIAVFLLFEKLRNKQARQAENKNQAQPFQPDFFSINDGNQKDIVFAPEYNQQWFDELDKKYSWDNFGAYDNRFWEYMYNLFDTLPALAKDKTSSEMDFFNKLTRGQKIIFSVLVFNGDTDNGGVHQFFINRTEFCFAVLESFKELKLDKLARDYEVCLNEFIGTTDSYAKRKAIFNDPGNSEESRWQSFKDHSNDMTSGKYIEEYYYKDDFRKELYKTVVDYIDNHLGQFVRR